MPAGYSQKSLVAKLGIVSGFRIVLLNAPDDYRETLGKLPENVRVLSRLGADVDFIQFFATRRSELEKRFARLRAALVPAGILWVSWPKQTAGVDTDLSRDVVREIGLSQGLVDVKICAVDETWSGLKFVRRRRDR